MNEITDARLHAESRYGDDENAVALEFARLLGAQCGESARREAGTGVDIDGVSLLPTAPQQGDWEWLESALKRKPTPDEATAFERGYAGAIG